MGNHMLTTDDNPYNPHLQYREWYAWDVEAGYNTASFLARIVVASDSMSEADEDLAIETAIQEIVEHNVLGIYRKITANQEALGLPTDRGD